MNNDISPQCSFPHKRSDSQSKQSNIKNVKNIPENIRKISHTLEIIIFVIPFL